MTKRQNERQAPNPPAPESRPGRGALPVSIFSLLISLLFVLYGIYILTAVDGPNMLIAFAVAAILYGLLGLVILACAYKIRSSWCVIAIIASAVGWLGVYVLALASGVLTGLQLSGFFLLALALWCNWFAVVKVVKAGEAKS